MINEGNSVLPSKELSCKWAHAQFWPMNCETALKDFSHLQTEVQEWECHSYPTSKFLMLLGKDVVTGAEATILRSRGV